MNGEEEGEVKDQQALLYETKHLRPRFLGSHCEPEQRMQAGFILLESRCISNKVVCVCVCVCVES